MSVKQKIRFISKKYNIFDLKRWWFLSTLLLWRYLPSAPFLQKHDHFRDNESARLELMDQVNHLCVALGLLALQDLNENIEAAGSKNAAQQLLENQVVDSTPIVYVRHCGATERRAASCEFIFLYLMCTFCRRVMWATSRRSTVLLARNQLGTQEGAKRFLRGAHIF